MIERVTSPQDRGKIFELLEQISTSEKSIQETKNYYAEVENLKYQSDKMVQCGIKLREEIKSLKEDIRKIETENASLRQIENQYQRELQEEKAQREEEERKRRMKLNCPILIQELQLPQLISELNVNISNANFGDINHISQPKVAFYGVNFTARFESTNLDLEQLKNFKSKVPGAQTVVLALTPGSADYGNTAPDSLSTGDKVIQLYFQPTTPHKLNIPHCQKAFGEIRGIIEGHRKQLL